MKTFRWCLAVMSLSLLGALSLLQVGCDTQSGNEVVRNVSINVSGIYRNADGVTNRQSGNKVTSLNLSQSGDQLFAIDNNGSRWTGTIGNADGGQATVTLKGLTTAGVKVVITGAINVSGNNGTLSGTWVEPGFIGDVFATGEVVPTPTVKPTAVGTSTGGATATPTTVATLVPGATATSVIVFPPIPG
jgi:hypothetical protein